MPPQGSAKRRRPLPTVPLPLPTEQVTLPPRRHLWWRSAFLMNHARGRWAHAGAELRALKPSAAVAARVVATADMVGVHVRNVFDAPRDAATAHETLGAAATSRPPVHSASLPAAPGPPRAPPLSNVEAPAAPAPPFSPMHTPACGSPATPSRGVALACLMHSPSALPR